MTKHSTVPCFHDAGAFVSSWDHIYRFLFSHLDGPVNDIIIIITHLHLLSTSTVTTTTTITLLTTTTSIGATPIRTASTITTTHLHIFSVNLQVV